MFLIPVYQHFIKQLQIYRHFSSIKRSCFNGNSLQIF